MTVADQPAIFLDRYRYFAMLALDESQADNTSLGGLAPLVEQLAGADWQKTSRSESVMVDIPIHPDLAEVLKALPHDRLFLARVEGNP